MPTSASSPSSRPSPRTPGGTWSSPGRPSGARTPGPPWPPPRWSPSGSASAPCSPRPPATGRGTSPRGWPRSTGSPHGRVTLGVGLGALHGNWLAFEPDEGRAVRAAQARRGARDLRRADGRPALRVHRRALQRPAGPRAHPAAAGAAPAPAGLVRRHARARAAPGSARSSGPPAGRASSRRSPAAPSRTRGSHLTPESPARGRRPHRRAARGRRPRRWTGYDVVVEGDSHGSFGAVRPPVQQWADAGATWWVESWWDLPDSRRGPRRDPAPARAGPAPVTTAGCRSGAASRPPADAAAMVALRAVMFEAMGTASAAIADPGWRRRGARLVRRPRRRPRGAGRRRRGRGAGRVAARSAR